MVVSRTSLSIAILAISLFGFCRTSSAQIGPFTANADTLHLWNFDDGTVGTLQTTYADSGTSPLTLNNIDQSTQTVNSAAGNTPLTADVTNVAGQTGFGNAVNFTNNLIIPNTPNTGSETTSPHRPILLAAAALNNADGDAVPFTFASPTTGAFTWEAFIQFNTAFNPAANNFRTGTSTSNPVSSGGNYPMDLIMGDGDANAHRNFQFRIDQIGSGSADTVGTSGTTLPRIEFANLNGIVSNQGIAIVIPTSGPNGLTPAAVTNGDWFHIAVEYTGTPGATGNLSFFWTDVTANPTQTTPSFLGSTKMNLSLNQALANDPDFSVGDEARDVGSGLGEGESFDGSIDSVRMSDISLYPVPEPSTLILASLGLVGLIGASRRRK